jgi:glycosyltransferase involved in cell wall biosynthesis
MRLIALLTDAFGGRGGIAQFNRDLLWALCGHPACEEVVALPRVVPDAPEEEMPENLSFRSETAGVKSAFVGATLRELFSRRACDGVLCGHINLLPLAWALAHWKGVPLLLVVHGLEARTPSAKPLSNWLASQVDGFVAASRFTKERFLGWADLDAKRGRVIPTGIADRTRFTPGPKSPALLDRYGLEDRTLLLTLGRLPVQEKRKGHDEVLEVLPELVEERPDLAYLICGDGDDRPRLERKAKRLSLAGRVVFAGYVPEEEKVAHYRLADAFVMPGRTEGFGIVYLEALACGVPVVASNADASWEAVREGALGAVVDPDDPADLKRGIRGALGQQRGTVPDGLDYFSKERFTERWHRLIDDCFCKPGNATMGAV